MRRTILTSALAAAALVLASCSTPYGSSGFQYHRTNATAGAGYGAAAGGLIGAVIGNQSDELAEGALLGAAIGAAAGYALGNEADKAQRHGPAAPYLSRELSSRSP